MNERPTPSEETETPEHGAREAGEGDSPEDRGGADLPSGEHDVPAAESAGEAGGGGEAPPHEEAPRKPTYIERLEAELADKDRTLREYIDAYKSAVADMNAAKERLRRDQDKTLQRERASFLREVLDVMDNLDRCVDGVRRTGNVESIVHGLELVQRAFVEKLRALGVERVEAQGARFDPRVHEAIGTVPVRAPEQDQVVFHEARPGYLMGAEVLRPAQVIVGALAEG